MFRSYRHEIVLAVLLVLLMGIAGSLMPNFVALHGQLILSKYLWATAILAISMTLIVITGGIDLSVGSAMGLCAVAFGIGYQYTGSVFISSLVCIAMGWLGGMANGWLIAQLRVHPLIITLATFAGFRGIAEGVSQGASYTKFGPAFGQLARGVVLGIPVPAYIFVFLAVLASILLTRTPTGRFIYAMGHNEKASMFSGVPVSRIKFQLYALSGALAGLATLVDISIIDTAKANAGQGIELDVITAVVIGGTSIFGGRGKIIGTVLGLLLIHEAKLFVGQYWQIDELKSIVVGLLLIGSLLSQRFLFAEQRQ